MLSGTFIWGNWLDISVPLIDGLFLSLLESREGPANARGL